MHRLTLAGIVALLAPAGCRDAGGDAAGATFTSRDSAGVRIIESHAPLWQTEEDAWRIDARPIVDIGVTYGSGPYELDRVRGALRLDDGRIVIGELAANIKYFDSTGKHLTTLARRGQGPGEGGWSPGFITIVATRSSCGRRGSAVRGRTCRMRTSSMRTGTTVAR